MDRCAVVLLSGCLPGAGIERRVLPAVKTEVVLIGDKDPRARLVLKDEGASLSSISLDTGTRLDS